MSKIIKIHAISEDNCFFLTGDISGLIENSRIRMTLKRLKFKTGKEKILIPYEAKTQIETLQDVQELLDKFGFAYQLSEETKKNVSSFDREQEKFSEFTNYAKRIRNNDFKNYPELIEEFDNFQAVLKKNIKRTLYPLQLLSSYHLAFAQNACNFSVPGSGKTSIVYGAYTYLKSLPKDHPKYVDKLLVVGPLSSFAPWENEYSECFGKKITAKRLSGDISMSKDVKKQHLYSGKPAELILISHAGVNKLQDEIVDFLKKNKTMVVVDEAHRVKNPEGVWGQSVVEIAKEARARVILTGTPVPNGYEDLFNLYQFLYPFKYKDILGFHYGNLADMTKSKEYDSRRVKEFIDKINPFFVRIKKSDLKLPPPEAPHIIEVAMDNLQREIYDFIEVKYVRSFQHNSSGTVKDVLNKAKLIRLRQAATNPSLLTKPIKETLDSDDLDYSAMVNNMPNEFQDDSEILKKIFDYSNNNIPNKFEEVERIVLEEIIANKGKVIIWTIFVQNAKGLKNFLIENNIDSELLIGEVETSEREKIIKKFNDPKNYDFSVVIANPFAVAESISLHKGCHNAIYLERDYNCSNFLQSKDRIHRVGLLPDQKTNYYYILAEDSIDQIIDDSLNLKIERMEKVIDSEIPLFKHIDDADETDIIKSLIDKYARRT